MRLQPVVSNRLRVDLAGSSGVLPKMTKQFKQTPGSISTYTAGTAVAAMDAILDLNDPKRTILHYN